MTAPLICGGAARLNGYFFADAIRELSGSKWP